MVAKEQTLEEIAKRLGGPARAYFETVKTVGTGQCFVLDQNDRESAQCKAWVRYFNDHLGWMPVAMKDYLNNRSRTMTMPMEWPQWFDANFTDSKAA